MAKALNFATFSNIVNGQSRGSVSSHHGTDPATGSSLWEIPTATKEDVEDAVKSASDAFRTWKNTTIEHRVKLLRAWGDEVVKHFDDFSDLIVKEGGKPKRVGNVEAQHTADMFEYFLALKLPEENQKLDDREYQVRYTPLGVVLAICAWNFPLGQPIMKSLGALMAGNCCIVKPSPFAPYSALKVVEMAQKYLPPGVLQCLSGDDTLGPALVAHPGVHKITFTGSTASGRKVAETAARGLKRVTLELGGNDAAIVFPDVVVDKVATQLALGAFGNAGQICTAIKRVYVHESIYSQMLQALANVVRQFKVGPGNQPETTMGPLQNEMQYNKVKRLYQEAQNNTYKCVSGGTLTEAKGFFLEPTIVDNPPADSRLVMEEQFGPILPIQPWSDEEEVIERANNSSLGLGASVWSKDLAKARRIAERLEAGSVYINSFEKTTFKAPFGGLKDSGIGFETGPSALITYSNMQVLHYNFQD